MEQQETADDLFRELALGRVTESGKACVRIAASIYGDGEKITKVSEARDWIALSLRCDKAATPEALRKIEEKLAELDNRDAAMTAMRGAGPQLVATS